VDPSKKVLDLNCEVQDLLLEVVDFKQEVPDLRSGGIHPNLALPLCNVIRNKNVQKEHKNRKKRHPLPACGESCRRRRRRYGRGAQAALGDCTSALPVP